MVVTLTLRKTVTRDELTIDNKEVVNEYESDRVPDSLIGARWRNRTVMEAWSQEKKEEKRPWGESERHVKSSGLSECHRRRSLASGRVGRSPPLHPPIVPLYIRYCPPICMIKLPQLQRLARRAFLSHVILYQWTDKFLGIEPAKIR